MMLMTRVLRPTLVKRVVLALLVAFALVWIVLMARQFYNATDRAAFDRTLQGLGEQLLASIAPIESVGEARAVVAASAALINQAYRSKHAPGAVLMELRDARGTQVFFSPEGGQARLRGTVGRISSGAANGQPFRLYEGRSARWSLTVAAPELDPLWILGSMSGGLVIDILIAFPFVLVPIWFAVARGLRPLRDLSDRIAARGADDLDALGFDPKYAELQPLTRALDTLLAELRYELAREHGFVQDAAHELRTPLAVLAAQAHVLAMAADAGERAQAERCMAQAVARASHLIAQLLDLAQIDHLRAQEANDVDVAHLLRHELALLAPAAIARHIDLSLDSPDSLRHALDVHAFRSIVHNLVNNALAYVPQYGRVEVELKAQHAGFTLSVADDGPGIAPDQRALVFERFHRGSGHDAPGAGLGLAIVREAAARLQGAVTLADGIGGKGCLFVVTIAAHPASPGPAPCKRRGPLA